MRVIALGATLGLLSAGSVLIAIALVPAAPRSPGDVVYDYGVAGYCGTLTHESEAGFRQELAKVTARFHKDAAGARKSRLEGWLRSDLEWSNRGLGGFRRWCETEGTDVAKRFARIARGELEP